MKIARNLPLRAIAALGLLTLSLTSCIFQTGVPMVETEVLTKNSKTWDFTITKFTPQKGFKHMALDNPITLKVSNSFAPTTFGTVTFTKPDNTIIEFIHGLNCTMTFRKGSQPNDTLVIDNHAIGAVSVLTAGTKYSSITMTGFKDFKGNTIPPIKDPSYNFTAVGKTPYLLSMSPSHKGGLSSSPIKLTFNKKIDSTSWGKIKLISSNSNVGTVVLTNTNAGMSPHSTNFNGDTVLIYPKPYVLPANIYTVSSITEFKDKSGLTQTNVPSLPPAEPGPYQIDVYGKLATYSFSNGTLVDNSLNGYNLAAVPAGGHTSGLPAQDRHGAFDMARHFDGTGTALTSLNLKRVYNLRLNSTITTWFSPEDIPSGNEYMPIFSKTGLTTGVGYNKTELQLDVEKVGNSYRLRATVGDNSPGHTFVTGSTPITPGSWYHAAVVLQHNSIALYINGQFQTLTNLPQGKERIRNLSSSFVIGSTGIPAQRYYKGSIDELTIYNYPLSDKSILAEYNNTKPGP